jgi:hypothetical protein
VVCCAVEPSEVEPLPGVIALPGVIGLLGVALLGDKSGEDSTEEARLYGASLKMLGFGLTFARDGVEFRGVLLVGVLIGIVLSGVA